MKYSYRWLRELSGTERSPADLAAFLTLRAFEVESVEPASVLPQTVVVGAVRELSTHPNADRLRVAMVDVGEDGPRQIVCGAPNIAVGQKVAVALPGTALPGGPVIKEAPIRGTLSRGMVCSARELGQGDDHSGILVLPEDAPVGRPAAASLGADDFLLDIKVLPDRAHDCLSHRGMAREIAALEHRVPKAVPGTQVKLPFSRKPLVDLEAGSLVPRYLGARLSVSVGPSPLWLRERLERLGQRPVNNVVDVTNFVMQELGQPMHAFDADELVPESGGRSIVSLRRARAGEEMEFLDGQRRTLSPEDLVVADRMGPVALAGVMGGAATAVTDKTKHVWLESATFDGAAVRRARIRHGLPTDSALRFEKGLDPELAHTALVRAVSLLIETAAATLIEAVDLYPHPRKPVTIALPKDLPSRLLGFPVTEAAAARSLKAYGYALAKTRTGWKVTVPSFRLDVRDPADLVEDIGKAQGYEHVAAVPPTVPVSAPAIAPGLAGKRLFEDACRDAGFTEDYGYSFYSLRDAETLHLPAEAHWQLANPMNPEQALMRRSLLPGLLRHAGGNVRSVREVRLFETGRVYGRGAGEGPLETAMAAGLVTWNGAPQDGTPFYFLVGLLTQLFSSLGLVLSVGEGEADGLWHPTRSGTLSLARPEGGIQAVGRVGEVKPAAARRYGIATRTAAFECTLDPVLELLAARPAFIPAPRHPAVLRDAAFFVSERVTVAAVTAALRAAGGGLLRSVEAFDEYREGGKRSLAFHLSLGAPDRTLTGEEADQALSALIRAVEEKTGATVRR